MLNRSRATEGFGFAACVPFVRLRKAVESTHNYSSRILVCYAWAVDLLTQRIAQSEARAYERAEGIRSRLLAVAELLNQRGASEIWLFGSLVAGGHPHEDSDVDLAVKGLSAVGLIKTLIEVEALLGARVDLVRLEEANASLRDRIYKEGQALHVSA
jgi:predicted nucleotidyltransferase